MIFLAFQSKRAGSAAGTGKYFVYYLCRMINILLK